MARKPREVSPTGYYHVIQRGVGKQIIFEDDKDYERYIRKLSESKDKYGVSVVAYCLMNNHAHMLLHCEDINQLSRLMRVLGASYAAYYNIRYDHSGHVFQDRYYSSPILDDKYLLSCVRYIHNNPVSAGIDSRENYPWSSYGEYVVGSGITTRDEILNIVGGLEQFKQYSQGEEELEIEDCNLDGAKLRYGQSIINDELGYEFNNGFVLKKLAKVERDRVLRRLRREGYTLKQIELLTGISKRIIQRA